MRKVVIKEDLCKSCRLCLNECPRSILKVRENRVNSLGYQPAYMPEKEEKNCSSCALCAEVCPDTLIEVYREERDGKDE